MKALLVFGCLALSSLAAGCKDGYAHTDISSVSATELPSQVTAMRVAVTYGTIVTAHIAPFNSDEKPMVGDVQSADGSTLEVVRAYGDKNYAFLGHKTGKTKVFFLADGDIVATIDAEVTAQPGQ